ncbi:MAG: hypothetical protein K5764_07935 [Prevotella sp.]|nr:hypothetical protein [Prevotella sp.]
MKKITFAIVAVAVAMMAACGNKQQAANTSADSTETFEEQQIKAGMSVQLDSLASIWVSLKNRGVFNIDPDGKIKLTDAEKKVTPDYLITPDELEGKLETLSAKYRALIVFDIDRQLGLLYGMEDVWTPATKKLATEVNDPSLKLIDSGEIDVKSEDYQATQKKIYETELENGRGNHYWECCATAIVEQTYLLSVNQEKLLAKLTDKDAEDLTYRIALLINAYEELSEINPQLMQLLTVLQPLGKLNAISVDQLREQLNESKEEVANSRNMLFI